MAKILDSSMASTVADLVTEAVDIGGFEAYEAIPGMILAIQRLSDLMPSNHRDVALDEASDLLADGVDDE